MNFKQATVAAALAATTALTACSKPPLPTSAEIQTRLRDNPARQQRYEMTVTVHDAPGPFNFIKARASYRASNCRHLINSLAGIYNSPEVLTRFEMMEVSKTEWKGVFYTDALLDEDYGFGEVCHWKFLSAYAAFSANGQLEDTRFILFLSAKELQEGKPLTFHYNKGTYPRARSVKDGEDGFGNSGDRDPSQYNPGAELFSATLSIRKTP